MADVAFTCPQCGHPYQFAADLAGKRGRCKTCQAVFRIPEPSTAASTVITSRSVMAPRTPTAPPPARPADDGKVAFNCPACGHGYRLDAKLAGKQGRCTSCRGVFTIPAPSGPAARPPPSRWREPEADRPARAVATDAGPSRPQTRPDMAWTSPPSAGRPPATASTATGDSGWWELDSDESIPTTTARPVAGRPRTAATVATAPPPLSPGEWAPVDDDDEGPIVTARPLRPKWVLYASIAAGTVIGGIAYAISYTLVSNAVRPASPPAAGRPKEQPPSPTPSPAVTRAEADEDDDVGGQESSPPPGPLPAGAVEQHREAIATLTGAYHKIADGYSRIHDASSITDGNGPVAAGVAELRSAAGRGKSLPPLSPPDRQALIRQTGPPLLQAVDRVLVELRRLRTTPGLRCDFDRLIAAYSRTREEIQRELDRP